MDAWYKDSFKEDYLLVYNHRSRCVAESEMASVIDWLQLSKNDLILDMCCGAGRHTISLAEKKFHVVGFDLSETLLRKAQEDSGNLSIPFVMGDMRELPFPTDCFDVVLNLFTSFGYFSTDEENKTVISEMSRVLKPNGKFILDYMNPEKVRKSLIPFSEREEKGITITEERHIENGFVCKKIRINDANGERTYHERVKMYTVEQIKKMLEAASLSVTSVIGNFRGDKFYSQSERMIFVGKVG